MALQVWDRPAAKEQDAAIEYTKEQKEKREEFAKTLCATLSTPGVLEALGAFITPSKAGNTAMVALTISIPGITFENPDGERETTRLFALNINANIPREKKEPKTASGEVRMNALTYADLKRQTAERREAAKQARK